MHRTTATTKILTANFNSSLIYSFFLCFKKRIVNPPTIKNISKKAAMKISKMLPKPPSPPMKLPRKGEIKKNVMENFFLNKMNKAASTENPNQGADAK